MNPLRETAQSRRWTMIRRCTDPTNQDWRYYGARGISVCPEWLASFETYYADVGDAPEGMSLDRIDNDGNYEPGNVRWATPLEQARNRRPSPQSLRTSCPRGHPYDELNTYIGTGGRRVCKACQRIHHRAYYKRKRGRAA